MIKHMYAGLHEGKISVTTQTLSNIYLTIYRVIIDLLPNTNFFTLITFSVEGFRAKKGVYHLKRDIHVRPFCMKSFNSLFKMPHN